MNNVIQVNQLSKKYMIGRKEDTSLYHSIGNIFKARKVNPKEFWALKDISFNVEKGEVLGIIGKNGAGKSTLLKILSRITEPTSGRIEINGRVASLLEVGTGFHPELTGRENIFLNGSILGMRRQEIKSKFEHIVEFSGIGTFIDTPVKHYSSGMYVRLAFAVAAHLEPDTLIVDEVLSVGDFEFQRKCMGRMEEISGNGRTIIFVSHNMRAIKQLCDRAFLLQEGRIKMQDTTENVINNYLEISPSYEGYISNDRGSLIQRCVLLDSNDQKKSKIKFGEPFTVRLTLNIPTTIKGFYISILIDNSRGDRILTSRSSDSDEKIMTVGNFVKVEAKFEDLYLVPGNYIVSIRLSETRNHKFLKKENILSFEIISIPFNNKNRFDGGIGLIANKPLWTISYD